MELLVVATIILIVTAASIPTIKPMVESQLTKQAASTVSTYLNRARARAMATGRPCGVTFEYFDGTYDAEENRGSASLVLSQVETPPYYCGLDQNATVDLYASNDRVDLDGRRCRLIYPGDLYWAAMVPLPTSAVVELGRAVDVDAKIQFNGVGPFYPIVYYQGKDVNGNVEEAYAVEKLPGIDLPVLQNATFKVVRQPRPTMTAPVGLPQGAVVDLEYSGTESSPFAYAWNVTVMFSPDGSVDRYENNGSDAPTEPLYFLIGRWDRIAALGVEPDENGKPCSAAEDGLWNYQDPTNVWVSINPTSGLVTTSEVKPPLDYLVGDDYPIVDNDEDYELMLLYESREFARMSKRNVGGR